MCWTVSRYLTSETTSFNVDTNLSDATELLIKDKYFLATKNRRRLQRNFLLVLFLGNQSIGQYLSVHKDSFSNPPTNRRLEEAVVGDWPTMMKFKALQLEKKIGKLMTTFKCLHWTRLLHICYVYGIFLLPQIWKVRSHCTEGYEFGCVWTHDEKAPLRWLPDSESGQSFVRLTGCPQNECGTAVMQSPWLEPRDRETRLVLHYKLYGTSEVYLRLYLKTEDAGGQQTLFSKEGNYKFTFPKEWKSKEVVIPVVQSRHRVSEYTSTRDGEKYRLKPKTGFFIRLSGIFQLFY
ncbi:hypothetical protein AVEN_101608-1 [Araneus ventricosus]|uniref:Uncharacterized protein n=1 Tax=Araneus ventricosus TaxID=182803 RepID=A0A4Y2EWM3_ARAVE|nr:hypothetical protein AVEN_101608-1 [Araneus ventricosus]